MQLAAAVFFPNYHRSLVREEWSGVFTLTVKINNDYPCYSNQELINDNMLSMAKSATIKYVKKN